MTLYYRLTKGFTDFGKLIPETEDIYDYIEDKNQPHFKSIYFYNEEQKKRAEEIIEINEKKRPRGISGITDVITNKIVFDFDDKDDIEKARQDTIIVCERLMSHGLYKANLQICFSGKKGFAVEVEMKDAEFTPTQVKNIVSDIAGDLETFDAVVVNASRIFRVPLTKHHESGLYKNPISFDELQDLTIDKIKEISTGDYEMGPPKGGYKLAPIPKTFHAIKDIAPEKPKSVSVVAGQEHRLDFTSMPKGFTKWKFALLNGYFPEGTRSHALMILGSSLRYLGYSETMAYYMLKGAADLQAVRFQSEKFSKEDIYKTVISQVYSPSWRGGCYSEDSFDPKLQKYLLECGIPKNRKINDDGLLTIDDVFERFKDFAENIDKNTIKTGIKTVDERIRITTGMLVGLLGGCGSGKTSWALDILSEVSNISESSMFFSMDMGAPLIYQKLSQKYSNLDSKGLFELYKNRETEKIAKVRYQIKQNFRNVNISFKTAQSVTEMKDSIIEYEESTGKKIKLIVVDYLECLVGPYSEATANSGYNANALKDLATDLDLCVLVLLQTQKASGDVSEPLLSMRKVKGASVIEQACSVILSIWREGFHPKTYENDVFMNMACVKNRMGQIFQEDFSWHGLTGTIDELDEVDREELEKIRKAKIRLKELGDL